MNEERMRRTAVVTGGTSGIGLAITKRLLSCGHKVGLFSQDEDRVLSAGAELEAAFGPENVLVRQVNLLDADAVRAFFAQVGSLWGGPDILVCNAGYSPKGRNGRVPFAEIMRGEWDEVIGVNLTGTMICCQAVAPQMAAARFGRIVLIGSIAARTMPRIAGASYVASKAALGGLARALVGEYAAHGVTVNTVAPGRILTAMAGPAGSPANQAALARIPSGRLGQPEEVAALVAFLVSDEAGFINGAVIDINGGEYTPA